MTTRVDRNRAAWNAQAYAAWVRGYGSPEKQAGVLRADPRRQLRRLLPFVGALDGTTVANPLGSHGRCAVAMGLLGAQVTVFDLSESNRRYAVELAAAADIDVNYVCTDFVAVDLDRYGSRFDLVVMELGIAHWFADLGLFAGTAVKLLRKGGRLVLQDFHPIAAKADYFSTAPETTPVPYAVHLEGDALPTCEIRRWTLGEIVTAFADTGLRIEQLSEALLTDAGRLPELFTLVGGR